MKSLGLTRRDICVKNDTILGFELFGYLGLKGREFKRTLSVRFVCVMMQFLGVD